jgi:hypothetical protein
LGSSGRSGPSGGTAGRGPPLFPILKLKGPAGAALAVWRERQPSAQCFAMVYLKEYLVLCKLGGSQRRPALH